MHHKRQESSLLKVHTYALHQIALSWTDVMYDANEIASAVILEKRNKYKVKRTGLHQLGLPWIPITAACMHNVVDLH